MLKRIDSLISSIFNLLVKANGRNLSPATLDVVKGRLQRVEAMMKGCEAGESSFDVYLWIRTVQKLQRYGHRLEEVFRFLTISPLALPSRDFSVLASIASKSRSPYAARILRSMVQPGLIAQMLPELRNSDFALFLSSLARVSLVP